MLILKILLIGPMGAGKSTLGNILSLKLGWSYFDNDAELVNNYGYSKNEIESFEVDKLHVLESLYLVDVLSRSGPFIAGAAASVIDRSENRKLIEDVFGIYLRLPLEKIIGRAGSSGIGRQAITTRGEGILVERFNQRDTIYREVAKLTVELGPSPKADAQLILNAIDK